MAREELIARGFAEATSRSIAERAGVNPALIHYYFGSKEGLLTAVVDQLVADVRARLARVQLEGATLRVRMERMIRGYAELARAEPVLARLLIHEIVQASERATHAPESVFSRIVLPLVEPLGGLFAEGRGSGELRALDACAVVASIALAAIALPVSEPLIRASGAVELLGPGETAEAWLDALPTLFLDGLVAR